MNQREQDRTDRLRSVLKLMERSIDDARTRRTRSDDLPMSSQSTNEVGPTAATEPSTFDPLDTEIVDSALKAAEKETEPGEVRDEGSMFDFDGPRLKARAKRRNAS